MTTPALSLSRFPSSSISASPVDRCHRSTAAFRRYGPSFAYKPAADKCLLDLLLRIDLYFALISGFSVPPDCVRTCLVVVNSNSLTNGFNIKCGDP
ncbi:unnamed protein product [Urochloa humidicola]